MVPPFKHFPLAARLPLMFVMFFAMLVVASVIVVKGLQSGSLITSSALYAALLSQGIVAIMGFIVTSVCFSVLEAGEYKFHLRLATAPQLKMILLGMFAILVCQCFTPAIVEVSNKIPLPQSLGFLREGSEKIAAVEKTLTTFENPVQFILVTIVIALIPAIGEEMFFRGLLLGDMLKGGIAPVASILISGFLFSISHGRFDNFLAIWLMGSFLGYLYYVSGSLWLPIIVHFTNNFTAIAVKGLYNTHVISMNPDTFSPPIYVVLLSSMMFVACLYVFNKWKVAPFYSKPDLFT